jgi:hypothetical protein
MMAPFDQLHRSLRNIQQRRHDLRREDAIQQRRESGEMRRGINRNRDRSRDGDKDRGENRDGIENENENGNGNRNGNWNWNDKKGNPAYYPENPNNPNFVKDSSSYLGDNTSKKWMGDGNTISTSSPIILLTPPAPIPSASSLSIALTSTPGSSPYVAPAPSVSLWNVQ